MSLRRATKWTKETLQASFRQSAVHQCLLQTCPFLDLNLQLSSFTNRHRYTGHPKLLTSSPKYLVGDAGAG